MDTLIGMDNAFSDHLEHLLPILSAFSVCGFLRPTTFSFFWRLDIWFLQSLSRIGTSMGPSVNLSEGVSKTNNFTIGKKCSSMFPRRSCLKFSLQCCTQSNDFGFSPSISTPPVQDYLSKIGDKFRNNISRTTIIFSKIIRKLVFTF